tara:strand:+ start:394 stop:597 length:204 start_codon:yes stop_codon:yes gene_type:complete
MTRWTSEHFSDQVLPRTSGASDDRWRRFYNIPPLFGLQRGVRVLFSEFAGYSPLLKVWQLKVIENNG